MKSLKIDLRGASEKEKMSVVKMLHDLGYSGNPFPSDFYFYCIYASGCISSRGYSLSFGNSMKTFGRNNGEEITVKELREMK